EMVGSDWSSDVCSSDLVAPAGAPARTAPPRPGERPHRGRPVVPGGTGRRGEDRRCEPRARAGEARTRAIRPATAGVLDSSRYRQGAWSDDAAAHPRCHPDRRPRTVNRRALFQVITTHDLSGLV